ncbi:MAG: undecaprenyl-diphosphate phosphatase [Chitinophagaceae bacterium]|nr:undecaprenyl-diphosphate phosphatase [Chitinophagaceae bacterium]MBK9569602.1 undecaprenyl-diphosphate phosphatase [Chitinophagaceae bacterium]MBL0132269.1 undecaprenyl-diphosphate phosphatase [Chitinophagaceae bacterium]MBL0271707.1 undecaprenyl-diphosphate phosphatase [Chitinophagaceae bacterium]
MNIIEAVVIGVVEGLTEFLPVSSTGHMIITEHLLDMGNTPAEISFIKLFTIAIQLGAILAVVVIYWQQFFQFRRWQFYAKLIIGVIPALLFGYLFADKIDALLFNPAVVAGAMLAGGFVLLIIDKVFKKPVVESEEQLSFLKSLIIGCWQVLSMIPGVSRSAASIIGGMQQKLTRNLAAEFSFFLAVPTMFAATAYSLIIKKWPANDGSFQKGYELITSSPDNLMALIVGNLVAFVVAMLAIRFFITYLKIYGFRIFGIYRILAGIILFILLFTGVIH